MNTKKESIFFISAVSIVVGAYLLIFVAPTFFSSFRPARVIWNTYRVAPLAIAADSSDVGLLMNIGTYEFGMGGYNLSLARQAFQKAVSIDPGVLWGHYQLARIFFVEGKFDEALTEINLELSYHPENLRTLYVRGLIYASMKNLVAAENDFARFVPWAPTEWAGYNDYAWVLELEGKYAQAEQVLRGGLATAEGGQSNPWLWNSLGVAQLNQDNHNEALASFSNAESYAASLTSAQWHNAYPGNDPQDVTGLKIFREAIASNKAKAEVGTP